MTDATTTINGNDFRTISKIANRAIDMGINSHADKLSLVMDIEYTTDETPLDLDRLLAADDFNFAHDIIGIQNYLDRNTKKLVNCFVPRYAR